MNKNEPILKRIDLLIAKGKGVALADSDEDYADYASYTEFRTQSLSFLRSFVGHNHTYSTSFNERVHPVKHFQENLEVGIKILLALREDIEKGYLQSFREIVHAEVFSDFIEMAEHLLEKGYKDASAVITGSVLEEHLRQLATKGGIDLTQTDAKGKTFPKKAETLNADLSKEQIYTSLRQKQITAWLAIRNSAAHGKYGEYDQKEVENMIKAIVDFMASTPA